MAHTLAAHFLEGNFNAAFLADDAAILHALIFAAEALVILDRAKDPSAEKAITLRLEGPVVDGFRLFDLTIRPRQDTLGRRERNLDLVEYFRRGQRVERVVRQFLVHFTILE